MKVEIGAKTAARTIKHLLRALETAKDERDEYLQRVLDLQRQVAELKDE